MANESKKDNAVEHLGITEDEFDKLVYDCIDVYNEVPDPSIVLSVHAAIPVVRQRMLGEDGAGISTYEKALAGVMFTMGKGLMMTKVKRIVDNAERMIGNNLSMQIIFKYVMNSMLNVMGVQEGVGDGDEPCTDHDCENCANKNVRKKGSCGEEEKPEDEG